MGVILSAAYIVAKGSDLLQRIRFLKRSFIKFLQKTVNLLLIFNFPNFKNSFKFFSHWELRRQKNKFRRQEELVQFATITTAIR